MAIDAGQRLLHYRLIDKIGEGGMGVVWRAVDTSLEREVALKILPDAFSADAERLARFQREARLLASLNHPNIATIHGLHQQDGVHFLTMELLAGETLESRIARAGALDLHDALAVASQVAAALEAAHDQGVVHRDLKPANIQLLPDDTVKVLDFGLAKSLAGPVETSGPDATRLATRTSAGTMAGRIMGTAAYMSPEQARGKPVDRRTDVWAFGCVLYEMLTGESFFAGETVSDTIARILERQPDPARLPAATPLPLRRLLRRCLEKSLRKRLRHAGDALLVIEELREGRIEEAEGAEVEGGSAPGRTGRVAVAAVAVVVGLLLGGGAMLALRPAPKPPRPLKYTIPADDLRSSNVTTVHLSHDGSRIAYVDGGRLRVRDLDRLVPRTLDTPELESARTFWSPDGVWLGFEHDKRLWKIRADGIAKPEVICGIPETENMIQAAWGPGNRVVFNVWRGGMYAVSADGGVPEPILPVDHETVVDYHSIALLPDGTPLFDIHPADRSDVASGIAVLIDGEARVLLPGREVRNATYSPTGHLVYNMSTGEGSELVMAVPFSVKSKQLSGKPFRVADQASGASVSADGTLVYTTVVGDQARSYRLAWVDNAGKVTTVPGEPMERLSMPALSPDGTQAAVVLTIDGQLDLWLQDLRRGVGRRLTFPDEGDSDAAKGAPTWSPDGRDLVFSRCENLVCRLFAISADGTGTARLLFEGRNADFSTDGRRLVFDTHPLDADDDVLFVSLSDPGRAESAGEPTGLLRTAAVERDPALSPDGRFLAFRAGTGDDGDILLTQFPGGQGRWQVSFGGGRRPRWSPAGDKLYFIGDGNALYEVTVTTRPTVEVGPPRKRVESADGLQPGRGYDVAPDGRLLVPQEAPEADGEGERMIVVVRNWLEDAAGR